MAGRPRHRRVPGERGAAAVEFALVVPLLLLILFGIVSYGFMLSMRQGMAQAAGEGARAAAVTLVDAEKDDAAVAAIDDALSYGVTCAGGSLQRDGETVGTCTVSAPAPCEGDGGADCVTVSLTYAYDEHPIVPALLGLGALLPDTLEYTTTARVS
jgi:Flp pilus assembly protein TadG